LTITYTSKHHSDDDPGGVIGEILAMGPEFAGPAEDVLLAWTLRLAEGVDPAAAARRLLSRHGFQDRPAPEGACGELIGLLRETANFSRERLGSHLGQTRRRGGRKGRRPG
jgi:hypothetical protein